jgi:hypothetical protein
MNWCCNVQVDETWAQLISVVVNEAVEVVPAVPLGGASSLDFGIVSLILISYYPDYIAGVK